MRRVRDSQRKKLYDAERPLWLASARHESMSAVQAFSIRALSAAVASYPVAQNVLYDIRAGSFQFKDGRGASRGYANAWFVSLPSFARHELYILHELAHVIHDRTGFFESQAAHGPEFARIYLDLVNLALGVAPFLALKAAFQRGRVKIA